MAGGQNRSTAVMQRRGASAPDELDYFPTPPWAARALCEFLSAADHPGLGHDLAMQDCWEPACGEGHMVRPLRESFGHVRASDVFDYGDHLLCDFLLDGPTRSRADWIITNPPFNLGQQFVHTALDRARVGAAMLVRSAFMEGDKRHRELFTGNPPAYVVQFVERVVMLKGRLIRADELDPFNLKDGKPQKARSATAYSWVIWLPGEADTRFRWIPKSRLRLERPGDYPEYAVQWAALEAPASEAMPALFDGADHSERTMT